MAFQQERRKSETEDCPLFEGWGGWELKLGKKICRDGSGWSRIVISGWGVAQAWETEDGDWESGGYPHLLVPLAPRHQPGCVCATWTDKLLLTCHLCRLYPGHLSLSRTASGSPSIPCLTPCSPEQTEEVESEHESGSKQGLRSLAPLVTHDWTNE